MKEMESESAKLKRYEMVLANEDVCLSSSHKTVSKPLLC